MRMRGGCSASSGALPPPPLQLARGARCLSRPSQRREHLTPNASRAHVRFRNPGAHRHACRQASAGRHSFQPECPARPLAKRQPRQRVRRVQRVGAGFGVLAKATAGKVLREERKVLQRVRWQDGQLPAGCSTAGQVVHVASQHHLQGGAKPPAVADVGPTCRPAFEAALVRVAPREPGNQAPQRKAPKGWRRRPTAKQRVATGPRQRPSKRERRHSAVGCAAVALLAWLQAESAVVRLASQHVAHGGASVHTAPANGTRPHRRRAEPRFAALRSGAVAFPVRAAAFAAAFAAAAEAVRTRCTTRTCGRLAGAWSRRRQRGAAPSLDSPEHLLRGQRREHEAKVASPVRCFCYRCRCNCRRWSRLRR